MAARDQSLRRSRAGLAVVALAAAVVALLSVADKAADGRQAILKWKPAFAALDAGRSPYARAVDGAAAGEEREGYPTLPISAVVMSTLLTLGDVGGSLAFALVKLACAAWILIGSARLARRAGWPFPPWAEWALLLLSVRVLLSDLTHGNTNLLVGACVVGAALAWSRARDAQAGGWIALGAALKVTPALLVAVLLRRPTAAAAAGLLTGLALAVIAVPGLAYGLAPTLAWTAEWGEQMLAPYLAGRAPGPMQTEHINQSVLGLLARLFTDGVAIQARGDVWPDDLRLTLVALGDAAFSVLHRAVSLALLLPLVVCLWRRPERRLAGGLFAVGALTMLLLSERSWKHHHVTVPLAVAWCLGMFAGARGRLERVVASAGLAAVALGQSLSGSGILGDRGSDLAEALGAFTLSDLALLAAVAGSLLLAPPPEPRSP